MNNTIGPGDALTLSWPAPINTNFLVNYSVSYFTRSVQGRSPTSTVEVPAVMTSTTLPFAVFTTYTVSVYAIYAPPDGNRVTVNLLPPTMFTTQERRKNINYSIQD